MLDDGHRVPSRFDAWRTLSNRCANQHRNARAHNDVHETASRPDGISTTRQRGGSLARTAGQSSVRTDSSVGAPRAAKSSGLIIKLIFVAIHWYPQKELPSETILPTGEFIYDKYAANVNGIVPLLTPNFSKSSRKLEESALGGPFAGAPSV